MARRGSNATQISPLSAGEAPRIEAELSRLVRATREQPDDPTRWLDLVREASRHGRAPEGLGRDHATPRLLSLWRRMPTDRRIGDVLLDLLDLEAMPGTPPGLESWPEVLGEFRLDERGCLFDPRRGLPLRVRHRPSSLELLLQPEREVPHQYRPRLRYERGGRHLPLRVADRRYWIDGFMEEGDPFLRVRVGLHYLARFPVRVEDMLRWSPSLLAREPRRWELQQARPRRPLLGISWEEADELARHLGLSLLREFEWQGAARTVRGPVGKGPRLPGVGGWLLGNFCRRREERAEEDWREELEDCGTHPTGASTTGVEDLAGGCWEWCEDGWGELPSGYREDHAGVPEAAERCIRGGSWALRILPGLHGLRAHLPPTTRSMDVGLRLALRLPEPVELEPTEPAPAVEVGHPVRRTPAPRPGRFRPRPLLPPALRHGERIAWMELTADGTRLVTVGRDGVLAVSRADTLEPIHRLRCEDVRFASAWSHGDDRVVTGDDGGTVRTWDIGRGVQDGEVHLGEGSVVGLVEDPDTGHLAAATDTGLLGILGPDLAPLATARLWKGRARPEEVVLQLDPGRQLFAFGLPGRGVPVQGFPTTGPATPTAPTPGIEPAPTGAWTFHFSTPAGRRLLTWGASDGYLCEDAPTSEPLWALEPWQDLDTLLPEPPRPAHHPETGRLFVESSPGRVTCLDATTGAPLASSEIPPAQAARLLATTPAPDLVGLALPTSFYLLRPATGEQVRRRLCGLFGCTHLSSDGRTLVTIHSGRTLELHQAPRGGDLLDEPVLSVRRDLGLGTRGRILALAWEEEPPGWSILTAAGALHRTCRFLREVEPPLRLEVVPHLGRIDAALGLVGITEASGSVRAYSSRTGEPLLTPPRGRRPFIDVAFTGPPEAPWLAAPRVDGSLALHPLAGRAEGTSVEAPLRGTYRCMAGAPDRPLLALGDTEGWVHFLELEPTLRWSSTRGHHGEVSSLRVHPGGVVLSTGEDGEILRWEEGGEMSRHLVQE